MFSFIEWTGSLEAPKISIGNFKNKKSFQSFIFIFFLSFWLLLVFFVAWGVAKKTLSSKLAKKTTEKQCLSIGQQICLPIFTKKTTC
jgi:hypothetical protein